MSSLLQPSVRRMIASAEQRRKSEMIESAAPARGDSGPFVGRGAFVQIVLGMVLPPIIGLTVLLAPFFVFRLFP